MLQSEELNMCTVFAYRGRALTPAQLKDILERTRRRGPDAERIIMPEENLFLAFQRLSIMGIDGRGMQPFEYNGMYAITNGEIYGWRDMRRKLEAEGYAFHSDSDCETVLYMFDRYREKMFAMLDAEYASVIYDPSEGFIAARDPVGIRPLFYGYDRDGNIAFASEACLLTPLCSAVRPFPPGHYYKNGSFICYRDISTVKSYTYGSIDEITRNIKEKLIKAVEKRLDSDTPVAFLLSGGLDSSLVCAIASRLLGKKIRTFSIGMDKDPIDSKYAQRTAEYLGSDHINVTMTRDDVITILPEVINTLATYDITTIRASIGMYILCRHIHEYTDVKVLLTGEVSDELFGYKYTDYAPDAEAFEKESQKRVHELYAYDVLRADRCIADNSLEARVPFGDLDFVSYVLSVDPWMKMNHYGHGKYLLRKAFEKGGWLPDDILWRQKAAFSDAVGHSMVNDLKEYADQIYKGRDLEKEYEKYPEKGRPFTPESLLYREIFESFYPGQHEMIPGFWMPNTSWPGCDVKDPSARVLSNYGQSGC